MKQLLKPIVHLNIREARDNKRKHFAFRMLQSRKIVSIKTITEHNISYVKAMIKKSYGTQIRPAVILFQDSMPQKAHCSCPVGLSGLCCHVLALLLFLKHYYDTKEKLLGLTCTEQLQKWHRRSKKRLYSNGSIE